VFTGKYISDVISNARDASGSRYCYPKKIEENMLKQVATYFSTFSSTIAVSDIVAL